MSFASSITLLAALFGNPQPEHADKRPHATHTAPPSVGRPDVPPPLPLELTAFGDIYYAREDPGRDDFHIGSLEVDIKLALVPYVAAFGAIAYDPDSNSMQLASFTVDSGLFGKDEHAFFHSDVIASSGIIFGKFDVPFGIAYLKYGAPDNRLVTQPRVVEATHAEWNDLGAQLYGSTEHFNWLGYFVNGTGLPETGSIAADAAAGGRLGLKPLQVGRCDCKLELGASAAHSFGPIGSRLTMLGADIEAEAAGLHVDNELISLQYEAGPRTWGFYSQGVYFIDPIFFGARYSVTSQEDRIDERTVTLAAGLEIFPQGELRVAYERGLESRAGTAFVQIVGGSNWKPTGLRR